VKLITALETRKIVAFHLRYGCLPVTITMFHYSNLKEGISLNLRTYIIRKIKSRRMRWAGHVVRMGEKRNVYRLLVGKPEGKRATRKTKT
jgi:hypothetical protein